VWINRAEPGGSRLNFAATGKIEPVRLPSARSAVTLLVYAAAMTAYIYGFLHRPDADYAQEVGADELGIFAGVALLHVALGFVLGRRAILALLVPIVIAIPAGDYPGGWPETPVWVDVLIGEGLIGVPLVVLGVAIRAIADRRKQPRGTPRST
jgi:hypothetical protein